MCVCVIHVKNVCVCVCVYVCVCFHSKCVCVCVSRVVSEASQKIQKLKGFSTYGNFNYYIPLFLLAFNNILSSQLIRLPHHMPRRAHMRNWLNKFQKVSTTQIGHTKTELIMKTISTLAIAAIIGSVAMHGADARLGRRLSPWGQAGSLARPSIPTQGWFDEADQTSAVIHSGLCSVQAASTQRKAGLTKQTKVSAVRGVMAILAAVIMKTISSTQRKAGLTKQTKVSAVRGVMAILAAVQATSTQRKAGGMTKQTKVSAVRGVMANLAAVQAASTQRKAGLTKQTKVSADA